MFRRLFTTATTFTPRSRTNSIGLNRVTLLGKLSNDPQEFVFSRDEQGKPQRYVTKLRIQTSDIKRTVVDGEKDEVTYFNEYHHVAIYNSPAHPFFMENLKAGMTVYAEGKLTHRKFDKDGIIRYFTEIDASSFANGRVVLVNKTIPPGFGESRTNSDSLKVEARDDNSFHQSNREYPMDNNSRH